VEFIKSKYMNDSTSTAVYNNELNSMKKEEKEIYQDYETLKKMAREDYKKELRGRIEDIRLIFSKETGSINEFVAFGNKCNKEVNGYNQALNDIINLLKGRKPNQ